MFAVRQVKAKWLSKYLQVSKKRNPRENPGVKVIVANSLIQNVQSSRKKKRKEKDTSA